MFLIYIYIGMVWLSRLLRSRRGSPLIEEAMLLMLSMLSLTAIVTFLTRVFSNVNIGGSGGVQGFFDTLANNISAILEDLLKLLGVI
ncbi:MAG: hypothetical protein QXY40_01875 [Candidatus Methanomethylicia archaeon]